jgi:hypothetical protein
VQGRRRLGPVQFPVQPLAQRETLRLVHGYEKMRTLNVHQIEDESAGRCRIFHQILQRPRQDRRMIVRVSKVVQQHRLAAARIPPPEHNDLYSRNSLE